MLSSRYFSASTRDNKSVGGYEEGSSANLALRVAHKSLNRFRLCENCWGGSGGGGGGGDGSSGSVDIC